MINKVVIVVHVKLSRLIINKGPFIIYVGGWAITEYRKYPKHLSKLTLGLITKVSFYECLGYFLQW